MMLPKKYWTLTIALLLILASLVMISFNAKQSSHTGLLRKLVLEAAMPVENLKNRFLKGIRDGWNRYIFLVGLEEENRRLKKKTDRLSSQLIQYQEAYLESLRLQKILKIKDQVDTPAVAAEVIDREQFTVFKTVLINKGTTHGLRVGLPVLNDQGIVGRVTECSWHVSRVMLIIDENSNVAALLQGGRTHGVLQGAGSYGRLKYIPKTDEVKVGDPVITSGLGGIFPKGVILGVVAAVDKKEGGLFQKIDVIPSVDFGKLEEVLVLVLQKDHKS